MATCEMCGIQSENLTLIKTVGTNMRVCQNCSKLGQSIEEKKEQSTHTFYKRKKDEETSYEVISNYQSLINSALAKKDLTVHHLANTLNVKESTLNKVLTGKFPPEVTLAKRIGNFLNINLVNEILESNITSESIEKLKVCKDDKENSTINLADLIKEKLKEKNK